jgi:plasmid stabilization system protein ParE
LFWSPVSRDDLRDIVRFISRDSPQNAESFAYRLMAQTDMLQEHPEIGRSVPEHRSRTIREIIFNHIASSIASITSRRPSRLRVCGTQREALRRSNQAIFVLNLDLSASSAVSSISNRGLPATSAIRTDSSRGEAGRQRI